MPVRPCWIEKPGKPEKRPLGIPVVKDRAIQMATKVVIEPIFEANFLPSYYGFRPGVSACRAIERTQQKITFKWENLVIDADIVGFFDHIRQNILLKLLQWRISDARVMKLIKGWPEVGVMDGG
jgi:retron-type reverse transcriptase